MPSISKGTEHKAKNTEVAWNRQCKKEKFAAQDLCSITLACSYDTYKRETELNLENYLKISKLHNFHDHLNHNCQNDCQMQESHYTKR